MKLTIFTPTYNRGYIIDNLYKSLKRQTDKRFEWLVIDDGSIDNTEHLFSEYSKDSEITLRYYRKKNGGKHTAANLALQLAEGELFFVVDSDDYLADNAVERIFYHYESVKDDEQFCGVCGLKAYFNKSIIGSKIAYDILDSSILDYRFRYKVEGDKADVFKTDLLRKYSYPEFEGERWCPLSLVWNRFGEKYKVRYFAEAIYFAEYLPDGLSLNRLKIRKGSPNTCMMYYLELSEYNIPYTNKLKASINYWRFAYYSSTPFTQKVKRLGVLKTALSILPGTILYVLDSSKYLHKLLLEPNKKVLAKQ